MSCIIRQLSLLLFALLAPMASAHDLDQALVSMSSELSEAGVERGDPVFIRIYKHESRLELFMRPEGERYELVKTYPICAWSGELGPKLREGDGQSPEGFYWVSPNRMNPWSNFHLSFDLGFPNAYDRAQGRTGSYLMVHGACASIGCYAMTDPAIDEIYALMEAAYAAGQPFIRVHVFPYDMSGPPPPAAEGSPWSEFWAQLKAGHGWFEQYGVPPNVTVVDGRYAFSDEQS